jgi:hypothetical protein
LIGRANYPCPLSHCAASPELCTFVFFIQPSYFRFVDATSDAFLLSVANAMYLRRPFGSSAICVARDRVRHRLRFGGDRSWVGFAYPRPRYGQMSVRRGHGVSHRARAPTPRSPTSDAVQLRSCAPMRSCTRMAFCSTPPPRARESAPTCSLPSLHALSAVHLAALAKQGAGRAARALHGMPPLARQQHATARRQPSGVTTTGLRHSRPSPWIVVVVYATHRSP